MKIHNSPFAKLFYYIKTMKISKLFSEDISFAEYVMLELIVDMPNATGGTDVWVSDIVKRVEVTPQAVSKFIHLAVSKGYVESFENKSDRRSTGVRITDRGRAVLSITRDELNAFCKNIFKEFSEEELATMYGLMSKLQIAAQTNYAQYKKK
jgi:DNA-binding MarR family transcriptional regulator